MVTARFCADVGHKEAAVLRRLLSCSVVMGVALVPVMDAGVLAADGFSTAPVSVPDSNVAPEGLPQLEVVDVGHNATFDRVVFRFSGHAPGYEVRYVPQVTSDPSDLAVPLEGSAFILVTMHSVASAQIGAPPAPQGRQRPRFTELREIAGAGDFEGYVSFGLGLATRSGFRAFRLTNPDRLVVDVRIPSSATAPPTLVATGFQLRSLVGIALVLLIAGMAVMCLVRWREPSESA